MASPAPVQTLSLPLGTWETAAQGWGSDAAILPHTAWPAGTGLQQFANEPTLSFGVTGANTDTSKAATTTTMYNYAAVGEPWHAAVNDGASSHAVAGQVDDLAAGPLDNSAAVALDCTAMTAWSAPPVQALCNPGTGTSSNANFDVFDGQLPTGAISSGAAGRFGDTAVFLAGERAQTKSAAGAGDAAVPQGTHAQSLDDEKSRPPGSLTSDAANSAAGASGLVDTVSELASSCTPHFAGFSGRLMAATIGASD